MPVSMPPPSGPAEERPFAAALSRIDPRRDLATTVRVTVILGAVLLTVWALSSVVLLIFFAVLIGAMLRGLADALSRVSRLPTWASLTIVTLVIVLLIGGLAWWAGPRFVEEGRQLWSQLSGKLADLQGRLGGLLGGSGGQQGGAAHGGGPSPAVGRLTQLAPTVATSTLEMLGDLLVIVVTALYFAIAPAYYRDGVVTLFPKAYRERARSVLTDIGHTLQWWLLGQAIDMAVVGVLSGFGLMLLGVPLALILGVVAGLFTFVPYFGPIVSAIPAIIVAGTLGWSAVIWVVLIYLGCHGVEGYIVAPFVQRRTVELPPALTVFSMAIMAALFGPFGLVVATPVVAAVLVIVREVYVQDVLGDEKGGEEPVAKRTHPSVLRPTY